MVWQFAGVAQTAALGLPAVQPDFKVSRKASLRSENKHHILSKHSLQLPTCNNHRGHQGHPGSHSPRKSRKKLQAQSLVPPIWFCKIHCSQWRKECHNGHHHTTTDPQPCLQTAAVMVTAMYKRQAVMQTNIHMGFAAQSSVPYSPKHVLLCSQLHICPSCCHSRG